MAVDQRTTAETPVDPLVAACGLVSRLDEGSPLPVIGDPLGVDAEALHAVVWVNACWFGPAEVVYDDPLYLDFSSWPRLAGTGAASVLGHHRRQAAGAALAAPQWRALGEKPVRALLTERRLVLEYDQGELVVDLDRVEVTAELGRSRLELRSTGAVPVALDGPWVPYLTVALLFAVTGDVLSRQELTDPTGFPVRFSRRP